MGRTTSDYCDTPMPSNVKAGFPGLVPVHSDRATGQSVSVAPFTAGNQCGPVREAERLQHVLLAIDVDGRALRGDECGLLTVAGCRKTPETVALGRGGGGRRTDRDERRRDHPGDGNTTSAEQRGPFRREASSKVGNWVRVLPRCSYGSHSLHEWSLWPRTAARHAEYPFLRFQSGCTPVTTGNTHTLRSGRPCDRCRGRAPIPLMNWPVRGYCFRVNSARVKAG